ncbi:hypothetical protein KIPB_001025 [Kipferlia bialata]|uniref:Uncharacterized protein n=1 Tax=Kipferlia bialata TaxID=797122 RepID=A0A9K3CRG4_9EUKA|nr:hypothetical protein KIPB_001025 [Kipferlia bialata]|eukprot:g1025.t1
MFYLGLFLGFVGFPLLTALVVYLYYRHLCAKGALTVSPAVDPPVVHMSQRHVTPSTCGFDDLPLVNCVIQELLSFFVCPDAAPPLFDALNDALSLASEQESVPLTDIALSHGVLDDVNVDIRHVDMISDRGAGKKVFRLQAAATGKIGFVLDASVAVKTIIAMINFPVAVSVEGYVDQCCGHKRSTSPAPTVRHLSKLTGYAATTPARLPDIFARLLKVLAKDVRKRRVFQALRVCATMGGVLDACHDRDRIGTYGAYVLDAATLLCSQTHVEYVLAGTDLLTRYLDYSDAVSLPPLLSLLSDLCVNPPCLSLVPNRYDMQSADTHSLSTASTLSSQVRFNALRALDVLLRRVRDLDVASERRVASVLARLTVHTEAGGEGEGLEGQSPRQTGNGGHDATNSGHGLGSHRRPRQQSRVASYAQSLLNGIGGKASGLQAATEGVMDACLSGHIPPGAVPPLLRSLSHSNGDSLGPVLTLLHTDPSLSLSLSATGSIPETGHDHPSTQADGGGQGSVVQLVLDSVCAVLGRTSPSPSPSPSNDANGTGLEAVATFHPRFFRSLSRMAPGTLAPHLAAWALYCQTEAERQAYVVCVCLICHHLSGRVHSVLFLRALVLGVWDTLGSGGGEGQGSASVGGPSHLPHASPSPTTSLYCHNGVWGLVSAAVAWAVLVSGAHASQHRRPLFASGSQAQGKGQAKQTTSPAPQGAVLSRAHVLPFCHAVTGRLGVWEDASAYPSMAMSSRLHALVGMGVGLAGLLRGCHSEGLTPALTSPILSPLLTSDEPPGSNSLTLTDAGGGHALSSSEGVLGPFSAAVLRLFRPLRDTVNAAIPPTPASVQSDLGVGEGVSAPKAGSLPVPGVGTPLPSGHPLQRGMVTRLCVGLVTRVPLLWSALLSGSHSLSLSQYQGGVSMGGTMDIPPTQIWSTLQSLTELILWAAVSGSDDTQAVCARTVCVCVAVCLPSESVSHIYDTDPGHMGMGMGDSPSVSGESTTGGSHPTLSSAHARLSLPPYVPQACMAHLDWLHRSGLCPGVDAVSTALGVALASHHVAYTDTDPDAPWPDTDQAVCDALVSVFADCLEDILLVLGDIRAQVQSAMACSVGGDRDQTSHTDTADRMGSGFREGTGPPSQGRYPADSEGGGLPLVVDFLNAIRIR